MKAKQNNGQLLFDWENPRDGVLVMESPKGASNCAADAKKKEQKCQRRAIGQHRPAPSLSVVRGIVTPPSLRATIDPSLAQQVTHAPSYAPQATIGNSLSSETPISEVKDRPYRSLARSRIAAREQEKLRQDDQYEAKTIGSLMIPVLARYGIGEDEFLEAYAKSLTLDSN